MRLLRRQLVRDLNATDADVPLIETVWSMFDWRARAEPNTPIAITETGPVTCGELLGNVQRLSARLSHASVRKGDHVAMLAAPGFESLEAVLAMFAVGAVAVPLDADAPPSRSAATLRGLDPVAGVVGRGTAETWTEIAAAVGRGPAVVDLSAPAAAIAAGRLIRPALSSDPACVLLSSGAGHAQPAVVIEHRGMMNHIFAKILSLDLGPRDLIAQTASLTRVAGWWQLLAAIVCDGRMRFYPQATARDALRLLRACDRDGVTVLEVAPSFLRLVVDSLAMVAPQMRPVLRRLRWMVVTGGALPSRLARDWAELYGYIGLVHTYGATECSGAVAHHVMPAGTGDFGSDFVPIGRPVANTKLFVLDASGEPVQPGVAGELFAMGVGVARGYAGQREATERAFPVGVLPEFPAARFFRTGELVRMRPDGVILGPSSPV